uniref:Uncharacterized protein MANES_11G136300 n=1 Tax=Rhizophora mucronata TaxID=61149 RepID=A0A2P2LU40_RHIMU
MTPVFINHPSKTSKVEIFIDNQKLAATDVPDWVRFTDQCPVISLYPLQLNGSANVAISPAEGSMSAPILKAMEVFPVIQVSKVSNLLDFSVAPCLIFLDFLAISCLRY